MRLAFADCVLDTDRHLLTRDGAPVEVEPQVFDLLRLLAQNPDRLVTRDELVEAVWLGRIVSESAISARIAAARRAVGDDGKRQAVIRTVARRGLQMAVPVRPDVPAPGGARASTQRLRFARSPRGRTLAWTATGSGPPVLRFDWMGLDLELEWQHDPDREAFEAIGAHHSLVRFNAAGIGRSGLGLPEPDFERMAEDALAVADAAGLERFAVYAISGGTMPAVTFAARYPGRVSRMVIVGGYAEGIDRRPDPPPAVLSAMVAESWSNPKSPYAAAHLLAYMPESPLEQIDLHARIAHASTTPEAETQLRRMLADGSILGLLPEVRCPTLVVHSRHDRVHPLSEAHKLATGIAGAELVLLETANHVPLPGHPSWDVFLPVFLDFLARKAEGGAAPGAG